MRCLLPLRSFGDFVIDLYVANNSNKLRVDTILLPRYLVPLSTYLANKSVSVAFLETEIENKILSLFTRKHLLSVNTFSELKSLKKEISGRFPEIGFYLEEYAWRNNFLKLLINNKLYYPSGRQLNVYESRWNLLSDDEYRNLEIGSKTISTVTIFPDSRLKAKEISGENLSKLVRVLRSNKLNVRISVFGKNVSHGRYSDFNRECEVLTYDEFAKLESYIRGSDFIFSSDSMPLHFANLLSVSHFGIYNDRINYRWLTPYCKDKSAFCISGDFGKVLRTINEHCCVG